MKYLDPKADLTFKRVFGEHPDLVISLLNALLPITEEEAITDIEYLPADMVPDNPIRKYSIVDVRCRDKKGRQFLVEMQTVWSAEFQQRVLFNASKAYVRQLGKGERYELLQPVYSLNLVNDIFEPDLKGFYHHYKLVHVEHTNRVIEGLQLIFVELPKFTPHTYSEKKMQVLWLRYLTEIGEKTRIVPEELQENPDISKALTILEESAFSDEELARYEGFWDMVSVEKTLYNSGWRKGVAEGKAEGLAEGKAEGLAEGKAEGLAEGKAEGKAEAILQTAANLKRLNIPIEVIAQSTGLSVEEIKNM
ncbi:Rpn family recombination-promoting nuclease/putative transposase [Parabacteroides sp.]